MLTLTDNMCCAAWLQKFSKNEITDSVTTTIAHKLAASCIESEFVIHPQHLLGKENGAADALSRRFDLNDAALTLYIKQNCPSQIPVNFKIYPLPTEISSWVSSKGVLQKLSSIVLAEAKQTSATERGFDGKHSPSTQAFKPMNTSTASKMDSDGLWGQDSYTHSEPAGSVREDIGTPLQQAVQNRCSVEVSKKTLASWLRFSGVTTGFRPSMTKTRPTSWLQESKTS